jgi:hypothetical protein
MEFKLNGNGANNTGTIWLNADSDNFKVSIMAIPAGSFDGKINVEYSPNGIDWFPQLTWQSSLSCQHEGTSQSH